MGTRLSSSSNTAMPATVDDRMFIGTPIASAREIARSTMAVASLNEMFISLFLRSMFCD